MVGLYTDQFPNSFQEGYQMSHMSPATLLLSAASVAALGPGTDQVPNEAQAPVAPDAPSTITTGADLKATAFRLWTKTVSHKGIRFVDLIRACVTPDKINGQYAVGGKSYASLAEAREAAKLRLMETIEETTEIAESVADADPNANCTFDGPGGTLLNVTGSRFIALLLGEDEALRKSVDKGFKAMANGK